MKKKASQQKTKSPEKKRMTPPALRFSPSAWAKLIYFRDQGDTEISGFGISDPDDLLCVREFQTIRQEASVASISLDDQAIADYFDVQVDAGRQPEQFFRIWLHTHPGGSSHPSSTDESTFERVFGRCDWALMCIVAQEGEIYARLRFNTGPGGEVKIPVLVDYSLPFAASDHQAWQAEYDANIQVSDWAHEKRSFGINEEREFVEYSLPQDIIEQLEELEPAERRAVMDELSVRPELWEDESEVMFYD